jgi:hypothetical protein
MRKNNHETGRTHRFAPAKASLLPPAFFFMAGNETISDRFLMGQLEALHNNNITHTIDGKGERR